MLLWHNLFSMISPKIVNKEKINMSETQKYQIKQENLLNEIAVALQDVFVAKIEKEEKAIRMQFPNGQNFKLAIGEDK